MALNGFWRNSCPLFHNPSADDETVVKLVLGTPKTPEDVSSTQDDTSFSEVSSVLFNSYHGEKLPYDTSDPVVPLGEVFEPPLLTVPFMTLHDSSLEHLADSSSVASRAGVPFVIQCRQEEDSSTTSGVGSEELLDLSDSLIYGSLDQTSEAFSEAAASFYQLLQQHLAGTDVVSVMVAFIQDHPMACQVRYPFEHSHLHPLAIFSATGCVAGVNAAYEAFAEAIGMEDYDQGLPLHVAVTNDRVEVAKVLKCMFPEALSRACGPDRLTPLHLACRYGSLSMIRVAMTPTTLQTMDEAGMYPVHRLCQNPNADSESFDLLVNASALVATSVTMDLRNPLHVAAEAGNLDLLQHIYESAPDTARETDESLQVPLHLAARENRWEAVEFLVRVLPAAIHAVDENGDRPRDVTTDPRIKAHCSRYHIH